MDGRQKPEGALSYTVTTETKRLILKPNVGHPFLPRAHVQPGMHCLRRKLVSVVSVVSKIDVFEKEPASKCSLVEQAIMA